MLVDHFAPLADRYDVVLCDVWGVVHNGLAAYPETCDALIRFRRKGGAVVLITNAPRPGTVVRNMLDRLEVPHEAYDGIVSSGDVTRHKIAERDGQRIFHIGPHRDDLIFEGIVTHFGDENTADYVVCTGLFNDESENLDNYRGLLERLRARGLFMLCANPDLIVERGDERFYCAGAIADLYRDMGGEVFYAGKPHRPIYDEALEKAEAVLGRATPRERVIAAGDSLRTDLTGATQAGLHSLFVTGGIHAEEFGPRDDPDTDALAKALRKAGAEPTVVMKRLAW